VTLRKLIVVSRKSSFAKRILVEFVPTFDWQHRRVKIENSECNQLEIAR